MKYMGSKRSMLLNGLGEAIASAVPGHRRFVDMFTGSGAVAWHVAQRYDIEVMASDLQRYSVVLASSVISRTTPLSNDVVDRWIDKATEGLKLSCLLNRANRIQRRLATEDIHSVAMRARGLCEEPNGPIFNAYGGYYFSPLQALQIDALRATLPSRQSARSSALAALVWVASRCAAAPGHTAQPFKPSATAGKYLREAWERDVFETLRQSYYAIAPLFSKTKGQAKKADANELASTLREGDLAFLDPPYSGVHYSRFYHVLETLVSNRPIIVSGEGRYPPILHRPQSAYSLTNSSHEALERLFERLSGAGSSAMITFPSGTASNGLSGSAVTELADQFFKIQSRKVTSRFSTMGGNLRHRDARTASEELILMLKPRG